MVPASPSDDVVELATFVSLDVVDPSPLAAPQPTSISATAPEITKPFIDCPPAFRRESGVDGIGIGSAEKRSLAPDVSSRFR
jgi:hypothetical protein